MNTTLLQPRDRQILDHVARYRITTPEAVHSLFFQGSSVEASKSVLKRLNGKYLRSRPLYGHRRYYQLSSVSAGLLGQPDEATQPFGPTSLPTRFAVMQFCCMRPEGPCTRLTRDELLENFPDLGVSAFGDYYLESAGASLRLGRILVDLGGDALRFVRKVRDVLARELAVPSFRSLVEEGGFVLTLLTAEETKREVIVASLSRIRENDPRIGGSFECVVETIPELINFPRRPPP